MPLLIGPEMARLLPQNSIEPLGDFLLEGLRSPYKLYGAADAAELVPPAELWASMPPREDGSSDEALWPRGDTAAHRIGRAQPQ